MDFGKASDYADAKATEAIECSVANQSLFPDKKSHALSSFAASLLIYVENKTGKSINDLICERGNEYQSVQKSLARGIDVYGQDMVYNRSLRETVYSDLSIQLKAQEILEASNNPEKEKSLVLSEQYLAQAVREDGGDLRRLMVNRAKGDYHKLTLDQQDDILVSIQNGDALSDEDKRLSAKLMTSAEIASASMKRTSLLEKTKEAYEALNKNRLVNIVTLTEQISKS